MSRGHIFITKMLMASDMQASKYPHDSINDHIREAILEFGSETEYNLNCVDHIEYGSYENQFLHSTVSGLRLKTRGILLSELANIFEDSPIPPFIREEIPDITEAEWDAYTRLTTLLLLGFQTYMPHPKKDKPLPKSERGPRNWRRTS